jgi:hypothetical protein
MVAAASGPTTASTPWEGTLREERFSTAAAGLRQDFGQDLGQDLGLPRRAGRAAASSLKS